MITARYYESQQLSSKTPTRELTAKTEHDTTDEAILAHKPEPGAYLVLEEQRTWNGGEPYRMLTHYQTDKHGRWHPTSAVRI